MSPEGQNTGLTELDTIFILIFEENWLQYDTMLDFSVWIRTGSNPLDIIRLLSHSGKKCFFLTLFIILLLCESFYVKSIEK